MGRQDTGRTAAAVLFFLGSLVLAGAIVLWGVVGPALEGRAVGPDAEDMGQDPMLQLELDGTTASKVYTDTAREGGLALSTGNRTSEAYRIWDSAGAEGHEMLFAAVGAGPGNGVTWRGLECSADSISFEGYKDAEVDDALVDADVSVLLSTYGGETELFVRLSSDGGYRYVNREAHAYSAPYVTGEPCPADVLEVFRRYQPGV